MQEFAVGVIGVGRMGTLHAEVVANAPDVDLAYVVDARADAAAAVGERFGVPSYTAADEAIEAGGADGWLIATSTPSHPALAARGLEAGLHVLCEKPLSLDLDDGAHLAERATSAQRVLQVGFWRRFSPPWAVAKRLIDEGAIGRPLMMRLAQWDADPPPPEFCDPEVSGGLAIDCGVHEYDLAEWLTGRRITRVTARNLPIVDEGIRASGDVDNLVALLDLEDGLAATVDLSRNARFDDDVRTEILGSDGALLIDLLPTGHTRLATAAGVHEVADSTTADATRAGLQAQLSAFAAASTGGSTDVPGAAASDRAVEVGRAVQRSARDGVAVDV